MGLFGRRRRTRTFWRTSAPGSLPPQALHRYGIECVTRQDFKGMMGTGWALVDTGGIHEYQAFDFISDGYRGWKTSPDWDPALGQEFLEGVLAMLRDDPSVPPDIWSAPPALVQPAAAHYSARCWIASELLEHVTDASRQLELYDSITRCPEPFVPPRSMEWAREFALRNHLTAPWS